ncbi:MAG: hypothetical protein ACTSR8_04440 [Promethearchaeota archaeon]
MNLIAIKIPKWRIPEPLPENILTKIYALEENIEDSRLLTKTNSELHSE